jgi:hypothetical protein
VPGPGGATMQRDFSFHACLGPEVNQADVMELCGIHQLLDAALAGYHVTIFAYGQTGRAVRTLTQFGIQNTVHGIQAGYSNTSSCSGGCHAVQLGQAGQSNTSSCSGDRSAQLCASSSTGIQGPDLLLSIGPDLGVVCLQSCKVHTA